MAHSKNNSGNITNPWKKTIFEGKMITTVPGTKHTIDAFTDLVRRQFSEKIRHSINADTNLKLLKEWSSLQTMIVVNEIDKEYGVVLDVDDLWSANSIAQLFHIVQLKNP